MIWNGTDICRLLGRYLQCWMEHYFKDLVAKTERYAQQSPQSRFKDEKEHCAKLFMHLMFRGQVQ